MIRKYGTFIHEQGCAEANFLNKTRTFILGILHNGWLKIHKNSNYPRTMSKNNNINYLHIKDSPKFK